jgi:hypothetical protein
MAGIFDKLEKITGRMDRYQEAQKRSIPFKHLIKFSEKDQAPAEITREFDDIEFVVSDTEGDRSVARVPQGERPKEEIYVYSIV